MVILTEDGQNIGRVAAVVLDGDSQNVTHLLFSPQSQLSDYRLAPANLIKQVEGETLSLHLGSEIVDHLTHRQGERTLLIEPLTRRELEVLRLIEAGLTNREIATKLVIATGTVKIHAHNIFGKLGVNRRTQAVNLARDLKIL